jgi:uncharacterized protein
MRASVLRHGLKIHLVLCRALFIILFFAGCSNMLYYPDQTLYTDPATSFDKPPEDVIIKTAAGDSNHAWYFSGLYKKPKAIIVFCHGNGQNRSAHIVGLYWLVREGYDLLAIDYPGYADSDGNPDPENTVEAAKDAIRWAVKKEPNLPLIVYGQSLGGAISMRAVIDLKGEIKPALVVADSTFLSYERVARGILSEHWITWLIQPLPYMVLSDKYAPGDDIAKIGTRLLVIHSKQDQAIPFRFGEEIYAKAAEPKEFWPLEKGGHISTFILPGGAEMRTKFLAKLTELGL